MEAVKYPGSTGNTRMDGNTGMNGTSIRDQISSQRVFDPPGEEGSSGTGPEPVSVDVGAGFSFNGGNAPAVFGSSPRAGSGTSLAAASFHCHTSAESRSSANAPSAQHRADRADRPAPLEAFLRWWCGHFEVSLGPAVDPSLPVSSDRTADRTSDPLASVVHDLVSKPVDADDRTAAGPVDLIAIRTAAEGSPTGSHHHSVTCPSDAGPQ